MNLRTATIAAGLAAALCTGAAFAQTDPVYPSSSQQGVNGPQKHAHHGKRAQINADVRAGRISKSEGKQLKQQLKATKAQRRAQKQQNGYQPVNYPSPPPQQSSPPQQ
jgi:hypothetical protein